MANRSYEQFCGIARALDIVGERWTLLILRELLVGPRRFSDLQGALPGIGTALLTDRLRSLERNAVVARRRMPPPAASTVYELTCDGRALEPVLLGLARWGARRLVPDDASSIRPQWAMVYLASNRDARAGAGGRENYEFTIDGQTFHMVVDDDSVTIADGPAREAAVRIAATAGSLIAFARDPDLHSTRELEIEGEPDAVRRCLAMIAPPVPRMSAD